MKKYRWHEGCAMQSRREDCETCEAAGSAGADPEPYRCESEKMLGHCLPHESIHDGTARAVVMGDLEELEARAQGRPSLDVPPHTRLILASEDLLEHWGIRTEDGYRLRAEWGEQKPEGWYEPTFTVDRTDRLGGPSLDVERLALALHEERSDRWGGCGSPGEAYDDHMTFHQTRAERIEREYARLAPADPVEET